MPNTSIAHGALDLDELFSGLAQFGTDWLYTLVPIAAFLVVVASFARRSDARSGLVVRAARAAGEWTGLPAWTAGTLGVLFGLSLPLAATGFFWDVGWHIDIGRDEFLLSPPHVALLVGVSTIGVAGLVGIATATATDADVTWRRGRWRVPASAAAMVAAGAVASLGWGIDELWHRAYGIDVTMWSPPHLAMIASASLTPLAAWLCYAEAGPRAGHPWVRRHLPPMLAAAALIGLSAWQLEFDLGVPQWQALYHPVLIAVAAGIVLTAARRVLGRGGALLVAAHFVGFRLVMFVLTAGVWGFSQPRMPLYLAAALAVEAAYLVRGTRPAATALLAGAGIGTVGIAGEWLWGQFAFHFPWNANLLPEVAVTVPAAVGAALIGEAFGRIVSHRPAGIRLRALAVGATAVALALVVPFPRLVPRGEVTVTASPAGPGRVEVEVSTDRPQLLAGADRAGILAWQGGGRESIPLVRTGPTTFVAADPVPVDGTWKSFVWVASGDRLGAVPIRLAADPVRDDLAEVPVLEERRQRWDAQTAVMLREVHEGPAWPAVVAYTSLGVSQLAIIASLVAAAAALARRRRTAGWHYGRYGSLTGRRIVLTGAAGGIGAAARAALEAQGARVVGVDLAPDRPDTLTADVTDRAAIAAAMEEAAGRLGGIDVVIANAGVGAPGDTTAHPTGDDRRIVDVNLFGAWHTVAAAMPHLQPGGQVVVVASGLAVATVPYAAAYSASKRGVVALADVLRLESEGAFDVTTVLPGYITTPIHDAATAANASLDGVARREPLANAADAVVRAVEERPRQVATSVRTAIELWIAHHLPTLSEQVLGRRLRAVQAERGRPIFAAARAHASPDREAAR